MDKQKCASKKTICLRRSRLQLKLDPRTTAKIIFIIILLTLLVKIKVQSEINRRKAYARLANAILLQNIFVDLGVGDIFDLTDSEESSSSSDAGVYGSHQQFVLELHDLVKDEPPTNEAAPPEPKVKKHRKKKGQPGATQNVSDDTSSSVSESSVPPTGLEEHSREEFYDAHESYHGLTENQLAAGPVAAVGMIQARSEHGPAPKTTEQVAPSQPGQTQPGSGTRRQPSTIAKPTTGPQ